MCSSPYLSDSLPVLQSNRYNPVNSFRFSSSLDNPCVETNNERRLRKLEMLCSVKGGYKAVAIKAKLSPPSLWQILNKISLPAKEDGSRSERALGDPAARAIEEAYDLGRGWFDNDGEEDHMSPKELQLIGLFRELDDELQGAVLSNIREAAEERARIIERARSKAIQGDRFLGGRSTWGALSAPETGGAKKRDEK